MIKGKWDESPELTHLVWHTKHKFSKCKFCEIES